MIKVKYNQKKQIFNEIFTHNLTVYLKVVFFITLIYCFFFLLDLF